MNLDKIARSVLVKKPTVLDTKRIVKNWIVKTTERITLIVNSYTVERERYNWFQLSRNQCARQMIQARYDYSRKYVSDLNLNAPAVLIMQKMLDAPDRFIVDDATFRYGISTKIYDVVTGKVFELFLYNQSLDDHYTAKPDIFNQNEIAVMYHLAQKIKQRATKKMIESKNREQRELVENLIKMYGG